MMRCPQQKYVAASKMLVECGHCNACIANKRKEWAFRLYQENKHASSSKFITLTYADEHLVYDVKSRRPTLEKTHLQKFLKKVRWREQKRHRNKRVRFFAVGEYGTLFDRPHYHMLLFNCSMDTIGTIADVWGAGQVDVGDVTDQSINYVAGYVINRRDERGREETRALPFSQMSKGIGKQYLSQAIRRWHKRGLKNYVVKPGGKPSRLPRYYRSAIFTKWEKEMLRLKTLQEQDELERNRIAQAARFHADPYLYLHEKTIAAYNAIKIEKSRRSL